MNMVFKNKRITGILGLLPEEESCFDDEIGNYSFSEDQTKQLKGIMGYGKHRLAKNSSTTSDFCVCGLEYLLNTGKLKKEEIGAIVVVSVTPDYFLPHISNVIHGKCHLPQDVLCMDIPQACCGFLIGLMQSFMILDAMPDKKVVLFNSDVLSHRVSKQDRSEFPLIGDATGITVIENCDYVSDIYMELYNDGEQREALIIPAGGFACPCTEETGKIVKAEEGNYRSLEHLYMDGIAVLNLALWNVPETVCEVLKKNHMGIDDVDYFLFHQPNKFILNKMAEKIGIPHEKLFTNLVEEYGNSGGATIPMTIVHNLAENMLHQEYKCCLAGFGAGLSWGTMLLSIGNLEFCEMIVTKL